MQQRVMKSVSKRRKATMKSPRKSSRKSHRSKYIVRYKKSTIVVHAAKQPPIEELPAEPKTVWRKASVQKIVLERGDNAFDDVSERTWDYDAALGCTLDHIEVLNCDSNSIVFILSTSRAGLYNRHRRITITLTKPYVMRNGTTLSYALGMDENYGRPTLTITP